MQCKLNCSANIVAMQQQEALKQRKEKQEASNTKQRGEPEKDWENTLRTTKQRETASEKSADDEEYKEKRSAKGTSRERETPSK